MENIYSSNSLLYLKDKLAEHINNSNTELFTKTRIITPSRGMDSWLKTELSKRNGVFANFEFLNQDGLFASIYKTLMGVRLQNNTDIIKYRVYDSLGTPAFKDKFKDVADYFQEDDLRRIQLASKIADLFDQYQLYRPEMIKGWTNGQSNSEDEQWQQWLWKEIKLDSKAAYRDKMLAVMQEKSEVIKKAFPEIHIFGITIYTKFHRDFIKDLSAITDVHYYINLPSKESNYKNDLLLNFGSKALELSEAFNREGFMAEENNENTLLGRMQNQILYNRNDLEPVVDDSIQINSCYTPAREAECLYNYLTDLFSREDSLDPGDVLVLASDIDKYAPYIKAVFRSAPYAIPFRISGAANTNEDSIVATLEQILSFREEDLTSEKVISLLEHKRIKQRFRVKDTDYIRSVIKKANIRFGRKNSVDDDSCYVSWEYGLEKIILGYAIITTEEDESGNEMSIFPYRDSEASQSYDLLKLKSFYDHLTGILDELKENRSFKEWKIYLIRELIDNMIYQDNFKKEDREEMSSIHRALSFTDQLEDHEEVPFHVFMEALNTKLFRDSWKIELNTGNVTVSSPVPARGLPHKVVCFLGLDNDVFPRKQLFTGFDLLGKNELAGDRNMKESDKYLFLDTLLSAKDHLYLSYTGQNVKNNDEIPPSIVVEILYDYLDTKNILVKHPLHGFSSRYREGNERLFTYLYRPAAKVMEEIPAGIPEDNPAEKKVEEISIRDLVKFFQAPLDYYYNNTLGIVYEDRENILSETEIFDLDNLQSWKLKQELLKREVEEMESWRIKGVKEGYLPLKSASGAAAEEVKKAIRLLKARYQEILNGRPEQNVVIDTVISDYRITGTIDSVFDKDFLAYSVSRYPLKYKVEAFIKSLLLFNSIKIQINSVRFLGLRGNISDIPVEKSTANSALKKLLRYYADGNSSPLLFTLLAFDKLSRLEEKFIRQARGGEPEVVQPIHLLDILKAQAYPDEEQGLKADLYLRILFREEKLNDFNEDDLEAFKEIGNTLKLNEF